VRIHHHCWPRANKAKRHAGFPRVHQSRSSHASVRFQADAIHCYQRQRANSTESEETHAERAGHQSESEGIGIRSNPGISRHMDPKLSIIRCARRSMHVYPFFCVCLPMRACVLCVTHQSGRDTTCRSEKPRSRMAVLPKKRVSRTSQVFLMGACVCVVLICFGMIGQERSWLKYCVLMRAGS